MSVYYDDTEADCEGRRWKKKGKKCVSDDSDDENVQYPWDIKQKEINGKCLIIFLRI